MIVLKYFLTLLATGFSAALGIVIFDIYAARQLRLLLARDAGDDSAVSQTPPVCRPFDRVRWKLARQLATIGCLPLLLAFCTVGVPDGFAGVRISQIWAPQAPWVPPMKVGDGEPPLANNNWSQMLGLRHF
jgi:hypothetical protein